MLFCHVGSGCEAAPAPCRAGAVWDKQHGVGVERARLLEATRDAVARGLAAGNLWHTASHAEHARPMLQVRSVAQLSCRPSRRATACCSPPPTPR